MEKFVKSGGRVNFWLGRITKNILLTSTIIFFILFQYFTFFNNKIDVCQALRRYVLLFGRVVIIPWNQENALGSMQFSVVNSKSRVDCIDTILF